MSEQNAILAPNQQNIQLNKDEYKMLPFRFKSLLNKWRCGVTGVRQYLRVQDEQTEYWHWQKY